MHVAPLARPRIRKRRHRLVFPQAGLAQRAPLRRMPLEPCALLVGHVCAVLHGEVADPVDVAGLEREHRSVRVLDRPQLHRCRARRTSVPVVGVRLEPHAALVAPVRDHHRPVAHKRAWLEPLWIKFHATAPAVDGEVRLERRPVHRKQRGERKDARPVGRGLHQVDLDRARIGRAHADHVPVLQRRARPQLAGRIGTPIGGHRRDALELALAPLEELAPSPDHEQEPRVVRCHVGEQRPHPCLREVLARHRVAVGPPCALAEREGPRAAIGRDGPRLGHTGDRVASIRRFREQPLEDGLRYAHILLVGDALRIEREDVRADEHDLRARQRPVERHNPAHQEGEQGEGRERAQHDASAAARAA